MEDGWIKWHRKSISNPLFKDPMGWHLFEYCCLKANHEPKEIIFNKQLLKIERGQFIWGRVQASMETGIKPSTAYDKLKFIETLGYITCQPNNKFTIVTICNYEKYQILDLASRQQSGSKVATTRQQNGTNKNVKNVKNIKKNIYTPVFENFWKEYPNHAGGKQGAFKSWGKVRPTPDIVDAIMDSIEAHKAYSKAWRDGFIPHATTWLNQGRWTAEFEGEGTEDAKALRDFREFQKEIRGKKKAIPGKPD